MRFLAYLDLQVCNLHYISQRPNHCQYMRFTGQISWAKAKIRITQTNDNFTHKW